MIQDHAPEFYHAPPILERVASVYCSMEEDLFEEKFEDWRSTVAESYPHYEPVKDWRINVKEVTEDNIPVFDSLEPSLSITPRFSRKMSHEGFDWSIRCPVGQFTLNMHSSPNSGELRRFKTLDSEFRKWMPKWLTHFKVQQVDRLSLHYVNVLSPLTVPSFYDETGNLLLGKVITVFMNIPGQHECLMPPLNCEATVRLSSNPETILSLQLHDWNNPEHGPSVMIEFLVNIVGDFTPNPDDLFTLLEQAHEHIVQRFESVFTEQAKLSFKPAKS